MVIRGPVQPWVYSSPPSFAAGLPCSATTNHYRLSAFNITGSLGMEGCSRKCQPDPSLVQSDHTAPLCNHSQSYPAMHRSLLPRSQTYVGGRVWAGASWSPFAPSSYKMHSKLGPTLILSLSSLPLSSLPPFPLGQKVDGLVFCFLLS